MPKKSTGRVYLRDEEKNVLAGSLQEWNSKPNKKERDAYISGTVLPMIQELNLSECGPNVISINKTARLSWEGRVQVCQFPLTIYVQTESDPYPGRVYMV